MRSSETDPETWALGLVGTIAVAVALAVAIGVTVSAAVGVVLLVLVAIGAAWWAWTHRTPDRGLRQAEREGHERGRRDHARRVLLIANETVTDRAMSEALAGAPDAPAPTVDILAPILQSRTHLAMTDADEERAAAIARLEATVACARRHGIDATGTVGDPDDPLMGVQDALRRQAVSEVVVATHSDEDAHWMEPEMLGALRRQVNVPVRRLVVRP